MLSVQVFISLRPQVSQLLPKRNDFLAEFVLNFDGADLNFTHLIVVFIHSIIPTEMALFNSVNVQFSQLFFF